MKNQFNSDKIVYINLKHSVSIPEDKENLNNELEKIEYEFLKKLYESKHICEESKKNIKDYFLISFNNYFHAILILYFKDFKKREENLNKNAELLDLYLNIIKTEENEIKIEELNEFLEKKIIMWIEDKNRTIIKMNKNLKNFISKVVDIKKIKISNINQLIDELPKCIQNVFSECSKSDLEINKNKRKFYLDIYIKDKCDKNKLFKIKRF